MPKECYRCVACGSVCDTPQEAAKCEESHVHVLTVKENYRAGRKYPYSITAETEDGKQITFEFHCRVEFTSPLF